MPDMSWCPAEGTARAESVAKGSWLGREEVRCGQKKWNEQSTEARIIWGTANDWVQLRKYGMGWVQGCRQEVRQYRGPAGRPRTGAVSGLWVLAANSTHQVPLCRSAQQLTEEVQKASPLASRWDHPGKTI